MVTVDLADDLAFSEGDGLYVDVVGAAAPVPTDDSNLVRRALRAVGATAQVRLTKRIPAGGGLGGGSADAAAVLRWAGVTDLELAAALGADVPFCLVGGRARVTGVGGVVDPLPFEPRTFTLLHPALRRVHPRRLPGVGRPRRAHGRRAQRPRARRPGRRAPAGRLAGPAGRGHRRHAGAGRQRLDLVRGGRPSRSRPCWSSTRNAPDRLWSGKVQRLGRVSHRRAHRCALLPHLTSGATRHRRRWWDERLRPRAVRGAGPGRRRLRRLHPHLAARSAGRGRGRARASGSTTSTPVPQARSLVDDLVELVDEFTAGVRVQLEGAWRPDLHPRQLLAVGAGGPRPQAPARAAPGVDVPHPGPGQGRGRRRPPRPAGPGRGRHHRLLRRHPRPLPRRGGPAGAALPRRPRAHRDRPPGCRPPAVLPRRQGRGPGRPRPRHRRPTTPCCCSSGRIQPLKGADVAVRTLADLSARPGATLVVVGGPSGPDGEVRAAVGSTTWSTTSASTTGSASSIPGPTRSSPTTTGRPTCAWCPAGRSPSAWSPWRRPPAAPRSSPPPSAGWPRSSSPASPGSWSRAATRPPTPPTRPSCSTTPTSPASMGDQAAALARRYRWSITAGRLRRLYADLTARQLVECS